MYGGIAELLKNRKYYYHSGLGPRYSHFTEEGNEALSEFMSVIADKLLEAEEKDLDTRARELVIKGLKGEKG